MTAALGAAFGPIVPGVECPRLGRKADILQKLRVDFHRQTRMVGPMATEASPTIKVIQHLCLEAGRLMEDYSAELALTLPPAADGRAARLEVVRQAAADMAALMAAAKVLNRRGSSAAS